jgi:hypothetical protein
MTHFEKKNFPAYLESADRKTSYVGTSDCGETFKDTTVVIIGIQNKFLF